MTLSIRSKIVFITVAVLFFAIGANTITSSYVFAREYSAALQSKTLVIGQSLQLQLDRLLDLEIPLEDLIGFEKQCQDVVNAYEDIAYAMVVSPEGRILFHNDPSQHDQTVTDAAILQAVQGDREVIQTFSDQGQKYYEAIIPVFDSRNVHVGTIRIGFPEQLITQKSRGLIGSSVGVAVVFLGLAAALSVFAFSTWVTRPLEALLVVIQDIKKQGTYSTKRVNVGSQDEIGQIASAFNQMMDDLRKSHERIRKHTEELEQIVDERTSELRLINEQLQQDIIKRKQVEAALETYATRLEQSNRELEQFASVASHDLNEPLRKIEAFCDRLKNRYGDLLDERGNDYLTRMLNASNRMRTLINGLLTYARVTTKAQPFELVNLTEVVQTVVADLEIRIEEVGGCVEIGDLPVIEADALQMRQLMQNLISNALKFHRPETVPVVQVESHILDGRTDNERYEIRVSDNGIGFEEQYAERIFQIFQRLHGRGEYEGTGIGLATCRKIVERHGGTIAVESAPGQGATFIITLPVRHSKGEI